MFWRQISTFFRNTQFSYHQVIGNLIITSSHQEAITISIRQFSYIISSNDSKPPTAGLPLTRFGKPHHTPSSTIAKNIICSTTPPSPKRPVKPQIRSSTVDDIIICLAIKSSFVVFGKTMGKLRSPMWRRHAMLPCRSHRLIVLQIDNHVYAVGL